MPKEEKVPARAYNPSNKDQAAIHDSYVGYKDIWENVMTKSWRELNDRTLGTYIDDSRKRLNSYVLPREAQFPKKEPWMANVTTGSTRNKQRAFVGGVTRQLPLINITPIDHTDRDSVVRAEVIKELVRHSFVRHGNPEIDLFNQAWQCAGDGTIIIHDARIINSGEYKVVTDWDPITSQVKYETKTGVIEDYLKEEVIEPSRFFEKDPHCSKVQDQPRIMTVEYMDEGKFMKRYGKFRNARFVKTKGGMSQGETDTFFGKHWMERVQDNEIEVIKDYSVVTDTHRIIANGVLILDAPMLWGRKKKYYPFSKTYFEPFAVPFFRGNSLPNVLMDFQDVEDSATNSMLNKMYRGFEQPLLVGKENMQAFELADEWVTQDSKIYVDDVNKVKPAPVGNVTAGEMEMLKFVSQQLSMASVDAVQQGFGGSSSTAREIVIANEHAEEIKGIFFTMLKDLWLQKTRIRAINILMNYANPIVENGKKVYPSYVVPNAKLSTGGTGSMEIRIADKKELERLDKTRGFTEDGKRFNQLDVEEEKATMTTGVKTEIVAIPPTYLDEFEFDIEIQTQSLARQGKALDMALSEEKMMKIANLFPEKFQDPKTREILFEELLRNYNDDPNKYQGGQQMPQMPMEGEEQAPSELMSEIAEPTKTLPQLTGASA